jgi:hypothetical protein
MIGELLLRLIVFDFLVGLLFDLNEHELKRFKMKHITFIILKKLKQRKFFFVLGKKRGFSSKPISVAFVKSLKKNRTKSYS